MLIAQITDIHAAPDNDHFKRLERVISWLKTFQPDMLVLTGDLTDDDWPEGYAQIAAMLDAQPYPSLILPGNADNRDRMREAWGKERWAQEAFEGAMHFSHHAHGLNLLGLDTTVNGETYGDVTGHLDWLDKQLAESGNAPAMLFLHHHVIASGIASLDETMCRGLSGLEAVISHSVSDCIWSRSPPSRRFFFRYSSQYLWFRLSSQSLMAGGRYRA